jgi:hypothetical protein
VTKVKLGLGPPPVPQHDAVEVVRFSASDLRTLATAADLRLAAAPEDWQEIAENLTFAFAGYAAGAQRENNQPADTPARDWGRQLASDARRMLGRVGFDEVAEDARQGTWRTSELAAEILAHRPAPDDAAAVLAELAQNISGHTRRDDRGIGSLDEAQVNDLMQRALFQLIPTLQALALVGDGVACNYGGKIKRGGSSQDQSVRWLFGGLAHAFAAMFAEKPKVPGSGGRSRVFDSAHLRWFRHLFELVQRRAAGQPGGDAAALRDLAHRAVDNGMAAPNYDRLRTWISEAVGRKSNRKSGV